MPKTAYTLTRTLPDGTVKNWPSPFQTRRKAAQAVAFCLADSNAATRGEAGAFASRFQDTPPGETLAHPSGYAFTMTPVTPGKES